MSGLSTCKTPDKRTYTVEEKYPTPLRLQIPGRCEVSWSKLEIKDIIGISKKVGASSL